MKSKPALLFFIFSFVSINSILSQTTYDISLPSKKVNAGYVVNNNNDTLYGTIKLSNEVLNQEQIHFTDNSGVEKVFMPSDLKKVRIGNVCFTKDTTYLGRPILLKTLNDGYLKLFMYYWSEIDFGMIYGPIPIPIVYKNTDEWFLVQQGNQRLEKFPFNEHLRFFTEDNPEISLRILKQQNYPLQYTMDNVNDYNLWLKNNGKLSARNLKDSIYGSTELSFLDAESAGLLKYCSVDSTMINYYLRIKNYGPNTPEFVEYFIYRDVNQQDIPVKEGFRVKIGNKWIKIGTWRYYYPSKSKNDLHIKKEEYYNTSGKLDGTVIYNDINGSIINSEKYTNGKIIKP